MLPMLVGSVVFVLLRELWSFEIIQDRIISFLEKRLAVIFSLGFAVCAVLLIYKPYANNSTHTVPCCTEEPHPKPTSIPKIEPPSPKPIPTTDSFTDQIVYRDNNQIVPLAGAKIVVGQSEDNSGINGQFSIPFDEKPSGDTLVKISHEKYISRFLRYDDPVIKQQKPIELTEKMRIIVLKSDKSDNSMIHDDLTSNLEDALKSNSNSDQIGVVTDNESRNEIIKQLANYQQGKPLYDPSTLPQVGKFHGATHGLKWIIKKQGVDNQIEIKLENFKTAKIDATSTETINENAIDSTISSLINSLLFKIADIKILSPKTGSNTGHELNVEGYALYLPKDAYIYTTLLPSGSRHYPQNKVTVNADGSWINTVYVGRNECITRPETMRVNAVLVNQVTANEFDNYLAQGRNNGIDLNTPPKDNIKITRINIDNSCNRQK